MKRRIISLFLVLALIMGMAFNTGCGANSIQSNSSQEERLITKAEWITGLGSSFGMTEYDIEEGYFDDISKDSEIFPYVQSCAEWGIFEEPSGNFGPDEEVSREYAVKTAVMASEVLNSVTDDTVYDKCLDYALEKKIISKATTEYLEEKITFAEAQKILDWAVDEFTNREFVEYSNVEINEAVIDLSSTAMNVEETETGSIVTIYDNTQELKPGDVFITPVTQEALAGSAEKVVSVEKDAKGNLIVVTEQPNLEDIYKELDFAVSVVPDGKNVITYDGVTIAAIDKSEDIIACNTAAVGTYATHSTYDEKAMKVAKSPSFTFNFNFTSGKPKISSAWETGFGKFSGDITEPKDPNAKPGDPKAGELFKKTNVLYKTDDKERTIQKVENKFSGGYEITGSLTIKDIKMDVEVNPTKVAGIPVGIKNLRIDTDYTVESSLKVKGELKEELKISTIPITVPAVWGLVVNLDIIAYVDASGELEIKLEVVTENTVTYASGKVKKATNTEVNPSFSFAIDIEAGGGVVARLTLFKVDITNIKLKAGTKFKFSTKLSYGDREDTIDDELVTFRGWTWKTEVKNTVPVVTLSLGSESVGKKPLLALNLKWELVGEKGLIKVEPKVFFVQEYFLGEDVISRVPIEKTTTTTEATIESSKAGDSTDETQGTNRVGEILNIDKYAVSLSVGSSENLAITNLPEGYKASDIKWESSNPSIATVSSDGTIIGKAEGVATVRVYTTDQKYEISCTVIVDKGEKLEFNGL